MQHFHSFHSFATQSRIIIVDVFDCHCFLADIIGYEDPAAKKDKATFGHFARHRVRGPRGKDGSGVAVE